MEEKAGVAGTKSERQAVMVRGGEGLRMTDGGKGSSSVEQGKAVGGVSGGTTSSDGFGRFLKGAIFLQGTRGG